MEHVQAAKVSVETACSSQFHGSRPRPWFGFFILTWSLQTQDFSSTVPSFTGSLSSPPVPLFFVPLESLTLCQVGIPALLRAYGFPSHALRCSFEPEAGLWEPYWNHWGPSPSAQSSADGRALSSLTLQPAHTQAGTHSTDALLLPGHVPTSNLFKGPLTSQRAPRAQAWIEREHKPRGSRKLLPVDVFDLDDALPCSSPCGLFMPRKCHVSG